MSQDQGEGSGGPFWTNGELLLRVVGHGRESDRVVRVARPFALIGQAVDNDVVISDPAVSARHAYLHLDPRGLFVVDLVTRTGTRIKDENVPVGWLLPNEALEIAGRRIEVVRLRSNGQTLNPPPCDDDMLADLGAAPLVGLTLEPKRGGDGPWVIGSELVFLGWSASCGIQVRDASVARTHCALVRTATAAYVIDLCGHHTTLDERTVRGAAPLQEGAILTIGTTSYLVHIDPAPVPAHGPDEPDTKSEPPTLLEPDVMPEPEPTARDLPASRALVARVVDQGPEGHSNTLVPLSDQRELMAWVVETIQANQETALRQQGEFHLALAQLIRQIQKDNAAVLNTHLERIERVDRELASIHAELAQRADVPPTAAPNAPAPPPLPNVTPLRISRPTPEAGGTGSKPSTTWLLERVTQLETENRSAWKDLVSRLAAPRKTT